MPGKCLRDVALGQLAGCEMGLTLESEEGALGQLAGCEMGLTLESEEGEVPHLRWSQAPPLPWPRPGSADLWNKFLVQIPWKGHLKNGKSSVLQARNRSFVHRGFCRKVPFFLSITKLFRTLPLTLLRQTAAYKYFQFFCPTVCLESVFRPKKNSFLWAFCTSASQTHRGCGQRFAI